MLQIKLLLCSSSHKGKGKFKPKSMTGADGAKKAHKGEQKKEKKVRCNYCKELGQMIKECPKVAVKEAKKKEAGMAVAADTSKSNVESANVVKESEWKLSMQCSYDPSLHDVCMSVDSHVWYFDSGITSQRDMFTCLESVLVILLHAQTTSSIQ